MKFSHLITSLLTFIFPITSLMATLNIQPDDMTLLAPDGTTVTIHRDSYGVPHIVGESEVGVFFGQGFAVAQDRLSQLELFRRAAEGKLAERFSPFLLELDKDVRTMYYTKQERIQQFNDLPKELQVILESYRDGINTYLDSMAVNPEKYKPEEFIQLPMERWTVYKSIAIIQFLIRSFGQNGGEELDRLSELLEQGLDWFDQNRPINDANAPTTIHGGGSATTGNWTYSGMHVREEVIQSLKTKKNEYKSLAKSLGLPLKFGSFAVLISTTKSNSGNVMLLGAPQMGPPQENEPSLPNEVELDCPTFHAGGMTIAGIPLLIIGHTQHHAWTWTSGASDNVDVYIDSTMDASFSKYFHNGQWLDFEVIQDTIISAGTEIAFTHYRTIHGPVFGDDLQNHQVYSMKMTFWNQELNILKSNYGLVKATNLEEFEAAASLNPMSFNVFYAGQDQKIKFWHLGKYQDRSDGVDPRLPHKGDGSEEWGGFKEFAELPAADNLAQEYFVNWNNKPVYWWDNGDNVPWIGSQHVTAVDNFVGPINGFTFENLKDVPRQINDHGTYQQAIEFTGSDIIDENILPPGQSGFINLAAQRSPHFSDQWPLHVNWEFKDMEFGQTPVSVESEGQIPAKFTLHQNYPNPFNPVTTIAYQLPRPGNVILAIYNIQGQLVKILVNEFQTAGNHKVLWDASDISSGLYFYRITAGDYTAVKKSLVLK